MRLLFLLLIVVVAAAFTCRKSDREHNQQLATYYYKQTQCADPWQNNVNDNVTLSNVSNYLSGQGLHVASLQIKSDDIGAVCLACTCKTGKTIYVSSYSDDSTKAKFLRIGFQQ